MHKTFFPRHSRFPLYFCIVLGGLLFYRFLFSSFSLGAHHAHHVNADPPPIHTQPWDTENYVTGPPSRHFRDALKPDIKYITSWNDGGFTNEFITMLNMIYLGMQSDRVPIIPPFVPFHHVSEHAGAATFGQIFDIDHLRASLHTPIIEWKDIKLKNIADFSQPEELGCWSAWVTSNSHDNPRYSSRLTKDQLYLDVSYTPVPTNMRRSQSRHWDWFLQFTPLSALIFSGGPTPLNQHAGKTEAPFPNSKGTRLPPDDQLACFDLLYFVMAHRFEDNEWTHPWCPAWRFVGRHARFQKNLVTMASQYIARALQREDERIYLDALPPFIAVHVRRGDFGKDSLCSKYSTPEECFAPLSSYSLQVEAVKADILKKHGILIPDHHVILTSDEKEPNFWGEVFSRGWRTIDHVAERTLEKHGEWNVTIIDMVVQSMALGFVGTERSTVSVVSQRRVEDWNNGASRSVLWGGLGGSES